MPFDHKRSVKEIGRHVLYKTGLYDVVLSANRRKGYLVAHLQGTTAAERFEAIYRLGVWRTLRGEGVSSGVGSEVAATGAIRSELPSLVGGLGCKSFLDVGCGDWSWMRNVALPCDYIGVDIVAGVIASNRKFERPGVRFAVADAISGPLPKADIALCREILFHLSFADAMSSLANVRKAAGWLIATTDTTTWFNSDIPTGEFRIINLQRPPYNFPNPRRIIVDDAVREGRVLGLWSTADLPAWNSREKV